MQAYEFYIDDDRRLVPTLRSVLLDDDDHALAKAEEILAESGHHGGIVICRGGERLYHFGSLPVLEALRAG